MLKKTTRHSNPSAEKRPLRIAAEIKRDLPSLIRLHVELPAFVLVSIVDVEVSPDLSHARIFFSVIGENEVHSGEVVERILMRKKSVLRSELAKILIMRQHPELRFIYDQTPQRAARIESLLKQIKDGHETEDESDTA